MWENIYRTDYDQQYFRKIDLTDIERSAIVDTNSENNAEKSDIDIPNNKRFNEHSYECIHLHVSIIE